MSGTLPPGAPARSDARQVRTREEMWADLAKAAWVKATGAESHEARRWLERARRIAPNDAMVALSLALACLRSGDPTAAAVLFEEVLRQHSQFEAYTGLAASALQLGQPDRAATAMQAALSHNLTPAVLFPLAAAVAGAAGYPGWCALEPGGVVRTDAPADLHADGLPVPARWRNAGARLPAAAVQAATRLEVTRGGVALLGSPIDLAAIRLVEGFVQVDGGDLSGWAWHPHDPARDPVITVADGAAWTLQVVAREPYEGAVSGRPLARPRRFRVAAALLPPGLLQVTGAGGRNLLGSPLDPGMEIRSAAGHDTAFQPVWADIVGPAPAILGRRRKVDVVVPVYGGREQTLACLDSVLASLPPGSRLHIVDDCSPDAALVTALQALARRASVRLLRQPANRGFPAAANAGLAAAAGRDAVLLNSDTLVPPGWLERLMDAAYSAPGIGTVCPLSNEATILSYPRRHGGNPMPDAAGTAALAALAAASNGAAVVDIPVGVGFCMLIRRDCLDAVGPLREDLFAQGYGEENDFCLRARHRGWRNVAAPGMFVAHQGGTSFGAAQHHLQARNAAVLERLHPGYGALVARWQAQDPLGPARRAMDVRRWRAEPSPRSAILVTHAGGGGVDRVIAERAAALRRQGVRPVILRPDGPPGQAVVVVGDGGTPNLRFAAAAEWPALVRLLRAGRPIHVELHHTLGHAPAVLGLASALGVPYDFFVHDYAAFCPRIALVPEHSYCGEPPIAACEACVADHGSNLDEDITVHALVARSAEWLRGARRVVTAADDVATRLRRHFAGLNTTVSPWEDDRAMPPPPAPSRKIRVPLRVCVVGGIGVEKGFEVLLGCVRDAAARALPLAFTVVGHTADDDRLLAAGGDAEAVFITGRYEDAGAESLIRVQAADIAFLPSIWPETWCFTLSQAWRAGLRAAVFDIGVPAERVRRTGWGWVLPLGMPPAAINDWMLRQCGLPRAPAGPATADEALAGNSGENGRARVAGVKTPSQNP